MMPPDQGPRKPTTDMTRTELVAALMRFNPFGGYCVHECKHPGHSTAAYRRTIERLRGKRPKEDE